MNLEPEVVLSFPEDGASAEALGTAKDDWLDHYLAELSTGFDWAACAAALDVVNESG